MEITFMHIGEFELAMEHFEKALSFYNPEKHLEDAFFYALNPGVVKPCFAAWALWFLGQPDQALERIQGALALAHELSEPHSLAHVLNFAAVLHQLRREERLAQEQAEAAIALSSEHGLVLYQAMATITRGWTLIERGLDEEGIEQMRQGLVAYQATGTEVVRPHFLALLAEGLGKNGQAVEGLRLLEEALALANRTGEGYYRAELYRLKGRLLLMQSSEPLAFANAEGCFNRSIEIAQHQKAKSLELRSVMSLARLYQNQGKQQEARGLLSQIYNSFTEGFDTADLREAKALLDELS